MLHVQPNMEMKPSKLHKFWKDDHFADMLCHHHMLKHTDVDSDED